MRDNEKAIALRAVRAFQDATGLNAQYQPLVKNEHEYPDGIVRIVNGNQILKLAAEVKATINRTILGLIHQQVLRLGQILLITGYVNPELANALRDEGIPFIDTAGNAFIKEPPLYIFIKGNKPKDEFKGDRTKRLFKPSGLRVLFTLLNNPGAENNPYRDIATKAKVALGTVGWVFNDLRETGFMLNLGKKQRRLVKKTNLLRRWVEAYPEQLRPKLILGTFKMDNWNWWKNMEPADYDAFWGGEVAAAKLTGYLKPEKFAIYTAHPPGNIIYEHKLKKDPDGNVEILKTFWYFTCETVEIGIAPPLLVYAELLATGDPRNIETAEMIYDKHLAGLVWEN